MFCIVYRMAEKYGMKLVFKKPFADYFNENITDRDHKALIARMSALEVSINHKTEPSKLSMQTMIRLLPKGAVRLGSAVFLNLLACRGDQIL